MGYIDVAFQTYSFLLSLCLGSAFCVVYDFLSAVRKFRFNGTVATFITDILFWLFAAMVTYCFLLLTVKGQVRFFVIFGIFASFLLTRVVVSKVVFKVFVNIMTFFDTILHTSSKFASKFLSSINKSFKNIWNPCKKLLHRWGILLYNYLKVSSSERKKSHRGS